MLTWSQLAQAMILIPVMYLTPGLIFTGSMSYWGFLGISAAIVGWTYYRGRQGRGPIW